MSKRLSESVKLIENGYRRKMKKLRQEESLPCFRNLKIDPIYKDDKEYLDKLRLVVVDLLDKSSPEKYKSYVSKIKGLDESGTKIIESQIECPICKETIKLNTHWNSYICNVHEKMIFEIREVFEPVKKVLEDVIE